MVFDPSEFEAPRSDYILHITSKRCLFEYMKPHCGETVSMLASAVDCGFEPRSGQTKVYEIGICCFSAKYAAL